VIAIVGLVWMASAALATGVVPGVGAVFTADTENQNAAFSGSWIPPPSGTSSAVPTASPYGALSLTWTSGASAAAPSPSPVTGQTLQFADGGSGASASCGAYGSPQSLASATASTTVSGSPVADWWCYELESTSASNWTSNWVTFTPLQIFVPTSVVFQATGTQAGKMDSGDKIVITFNQNVGTISTPIDVCINPTANTTFVGDTSNCNNAADGYSIGKLTGWTVAGGKQNKNTSAVSVSGSVVTITLGGGGTSGNVTGNAMFTASSTGVLSSGSLHACSSASSPTCTVTSSGSF
jgi:hypothetical protein